MQEVNGNNPKLSQFLARNSKYILGEPKIVAGEKVWDLKRSILTDPDKLKEIKAEASSFGITFTLLPTPKFSVSNKLESEDGKIDLYLHESDIEDGGPQPRTKIDIKDPKIEELYESIEQYGQLDPCKGYPSPTTPGKYRLRDGHCRRFIIFNLLRKPTLWVVSQKRTEKQCYKDAFILNNKRNNLSVYDQGHYIQEVLMKLFPEEYPNQEAVAKVLGIAQSNVSQCISAYNTINSQKDNLEEKTITRVIKLTEGQIRPLTQIVNKSLQTVAIEQVVEKELSMRDGDKLKESINASPSMTPSQVIDEAKRIAEEKASRYMKTADKEVAKTERARDKIVALEIVPPEGLMKAVYGHLGIKGVKVTPEKAKAFASDVVSVLYKRAVDKNELDDVFSEADRWV